MTVAMTRTMSTLSTKLLVLAFASIALAAQACTLASPTTVKMEPEDEATDQAATDADPDAKTSPAAGGAANSCSGAKLVKVDVSKLTACGDGAGHCYPKSKTPGADAMKPCDNADEVCVADTILAAGGGKLTSCKVAVLNNAPGACMPLGIMPDDERKQAESNLKQDACAAGEVCAPCKNPLENNADTGLCGAIGVTDTECAGGAATTGGGATTAPPPAAACCGGNGSCLPKAGLPDAASDMPQDTCAEANVCVPKSMATGKAVTCKALGGFADGVCLDKCFNDMLAGAGEFGALSQGSCGATELCVPCIAMTMMAGDGTAIPGCGN